jgi:hypothetical protein
MKRTPRKRSTKPMKRTAFKTRRKKISMEVPEWFKKLPAGAHGSSVIQKKAWTFISRMVRQRDFETWGGKCVSCSRILQSWKDMQCGHYIAWANCNGVFKYHTENLAGQCSHCNTTSDGVIGLEFSEELKRRHGPHILAELRQSNALYHGSKLYDNEILDYVTYFHNLGYGEIHYTS